jgi:hypothetical protein
MRPARSFPSALSAFAYLFVLGALDACGADPTPPPAPVAPAPSTAAAAASPTPPPSHAVTTKRTVVSLGRICGSNVTISGGDGTVSAVLDVLENGRGPHVESKLKIAPDRTIASLEAKGHHTMGTAVDETFRIESNGKAHWKSREESGEGKAGGAFFVPISEVPDATGLLAQALLHAGGKLPLLPAGEARIEKMSTATVKAKDQTERRVVGYAIVGVDITPIHTWMNEDGSWFGSVSAWWSVVPEGWETAIEPLVADQDKWDRAREARLAKELAHAPPAAGFAFTHARVLDVAAGKYLPDQTVIVEKGVIRSVGPAASAKVPAGAEIVDLAGKALLPGLWDMHAHLGDSDGVLDIASGVTTARDVGNDPDKLDDYKKRWDTGEAIGPHVLRFGFIEGRNEKAASSRITAENEAEAKAAVEFFAKRGYEGIKIYNSMKPELVPLLAKEAHAKKMLVTGHIPVHMLANEAVRAGYDGIEHINMLFLNFFADHDTDTRTTTRFTLVGDKAAGFDLAGKRVSDFVALLKDRHTVIDPTLDAFENLLVAQQGKIVPGTEALTARLPIQTQRGYLTGGVPFDGKEELYRSSFEKLLAMVKLLHEKNVSVVAGTDMLAGLMLHHELELFVRAGLTPATAIRLATLEPARVMKQDAQSGSIAKGKVADMFVVDGDPLARIDDLRKVVTSMRGGVVFPAAKLYESVGVRP